MRKQRMLLFICLFIYSVAIAGIFHKDTSNKNNSNLMSKPLLNTPLIQLKKEKINEARISVSSNSAPSATNYFFKASAQLAL